MADDAILRTEPESAHSLAIAFAKEWRRWRNSGFSVSDGVIRTADALVAKVLGPE